MKVSEIIEKFYANEQTRNLIKKNTATQIVKRLSKTLALILFAALLCIAFDANAVFWIVAIALALLASVLLFKFYEIGGNHLFIGKIDFIRHDYSLQVAKGTGGLPRVHSSIRQEHTLVLTLKDISKKESTKSIEIVLPSQYEKFICTGDILLHHPLFEYPAILTNLTSCLCMNCGTAQSANNTHCHSCGTALFNNTTISL